MLVDFCFHFHLSNKLLSTIKYYQFFISSIIYFNFCYYLLAISVIFSKISRCYLFFLFRFYHVLLTVVACSLEIFMQAFCLTLLTVCMHYSYVYSLFSKYIFNDSQCVLELLVACVKAKII